MYPTYTVCWINIKVPSYQNRKSHCGDKIIFFFYLHNGISYTGKTDSLYLIRVLEVLSPFTTQQICVVQSVKLWVAMQKIMSDVQVTYELYSHCWYLQVLYSK